MDTLNLYIIAGCNGAGKTTASYTVLPEILECREFINADEIAKGLSPFNPGSVAIEAGKLMLRRIDELLGQRVSFSIETTLAAKSYAKLVRKAQRIGYEVCLMFFWLNSPELAANRVAKRVSLGGHNIPTATVYRRYCAGIKNLFGIFMPIVDRWILIDNSNASSVTVAKGNREIRELVFNVELFNKIKEYGRI